MLSESKDNPKLVPLSKWDTVHPEGPSRDAIRYMIFKDNHTQENGINSCIVRFGARIYIDEDGFKDWIANRRGLPRKGQDGQ